MLLNSAGKDWWNSGFIRFTTIKLFCCILLHLQSERGLTVLPLYLSCFPFMYASLAQTKDSFHFLTCNSRRLVFWKIRRSYENPFRTSWTQTPPFSIAHLSKKRRIDMKTHGWDDKIHGDGQRETKDAMGKQGRGLEVKPIEDLQPSFTLMSSNISLTSAGIGLSNAAPNGMVTRWLICKTIQCFSRFLCVCGTFLTIHGHRELFMA